MSGVVPPNQVPLRPHYSHFYLLHTAAVHHLMMLDPATVGAMEAEQHCLARLQTKSFPAFWNGISLFLQFRFNLFFPLLFLVQVDFFWLVPFLFTVLISIREHKNYYSFSFIWIRVSGLIIRCHVKAAKWGLLYRVQLTKKKKRGKSALKTVVTFLCVFWMKCLILTLWARVSQGLR